MKGLFNRSANFPLSFEHSYANNSWMLIWWFIKDTHVVWKTYIQHCLCGCRFFLVGCSGMSFGCRVHEVGFDRHNRYLIILYPLTQLVCGYPILHMLRFSNQRWNIHTVIHYYWCTILLSVITTCSLTCFFRGLCRGLPELIFTFLL